MYYNIIYKCSKHPAAGKSSCASCNLGAERTNKYVENYIFTRYHATVQVERKREHTYYLEHEKI